MVLELVINFLEISCLIFDRICFRFIRSSVRFLKQFNSTILIAFWSDHLDKKNKEEFLKDYALSWCFSNNTTFSLIEAVWFLGYVTRFLLVPVVGWFYLGRGIFSDATGTHIGYPTRDSGSNSQVLSNHYIVLVYLSL